ncbi:hypothetical protein PIB30_070009, partial [Stylosanthes scabra]|nr:hypothetical protein [Stylosanthes scabra]
TSVGEFLITSEKIGHAFGLNCRGDLFEKRQKDFEDKLNEEEKEALDLFKGKSLTFVQDMVKDCPIETDQQKRTFKRAFALFIQKSFLLPTSSTYISLVHLPVIRDIDNTQGRNWAHHVNSFLINGIKEFHEQGSQAVKGYHFVMMIIYFRESYERQRQDREQRSQRREWRREETEPTLAKTVDEIKRKRKVQGKDQGKGKKKKATAESAAKPVHDATVAETGPEPRPQPQPRPEPEPETEPQPQPDSEQVSESQPQLDPEPVSEGPQPQPEPEAAILFGPEPQEVIDGFVAACQEVEETEATIKACEEAELRYQQINQAEVAKDNEVEAEIRKIIEDVVTSTDKLPGRQEKAAPAPHKL